MKHLSILILTLMLSGNPAFTQVQTASNILLPVPVSIPGHTSSVQAMIPEAFDPSAPGIYWAQDSSWYSDWILPDAEWFLYEKNFTTRNGNGQTMEVLYTVLDEMSLEWENWLRYTYTYYPSGNYLTMNTEAWNTNALRWETITHSHYDNLGRLDTSFNKSYDRLLNIFTGGSRSVYSFNAANMYTEQLQQLLDTATGTWKNNSRILYTYTGDVHLMNLVSQIWNSGISDWENDMKIEYSYDANWYRTGDHTFVWDSPGNAWEDYSRTTITNNPAGYPVEELREMWELTGNLWVNVGRVTYTYNTNNQKTEILEEMWDNGFLTWVNYSKQTYTYFPNGNQEDYYTYRWNPTGSVFMDVSYYAYDSLWHTLVYYYKYLDQSTWQYTGGYRYIYTYNAQYQPTETLGQDFSTGTWLDLSKRVYTYDGNNNNTVELDLVWDSGISDWVNEFKMEHFYSDFIGIGEPKAMTDFCFFSNPLNPGETIICPALESGKSYHLTLLNLNGQTVASRAIRSGESYTVPQDLSAGMYLMQVSERGMIVATGKVIIKR